MQRNGKVYIEEVVVKALELHESKRHQYVNDACDGNELLISEVFSFLDATKENRVQDFFENGLPEIQLSVANASSNTRLSDLDNKQKLESEKAEEKAQWEGANVGEEFRGKGRYKIENLFRAGWMATLFCGVDKKLDKKIVIKIPRKNAYIKSKNDDRATANDKANIRNNFRREYDALRALDKCPNVVSVLDYGELPDGRPFMVQEFIDGDTTLGLVKKNKAGIDFKQAADIIKQASYGLDAAHQKGILHRDVKADNIMTSGLVAKLIDFNAADVKFPFSSMSTVFKDQTWGAPNYCSPEQLGNMLATGEDQESAELTPASDIYALAVTAYQLLTGQLPFNDIAEKFRGSFPPPSQYRKDVSKEIDELLKTAMSVEPKHRPQSAKAFGDEFADKIRKMVEENKIPAHLTSVPTLTNDLYDTTKMWEIVDVTGTPTKKRSIALPLTVIATIILFLLAGGYVLWSVMKSDEISSTPIEAKPPRAFTYWLDLYRVVNGAIAKKPIRASGKEPFTTNDAFKLNFVSPNKGYLYLLNEGKNKEGTRSIIYLGKFLVKEDVPFAVPDGDLYSFDKNTDMEEFWFVFSSASIDLFEQYKAVIEVPEDKTEEIRFFLDQKKSSVTDTEDRKTLQTNVKGSGETIAYKAELSHQ